MKRIVFYALILVSLTGCIVDKAGDCYEFRFQNHSNYSMEMRTNDSTNGIFPEILRLDKGEEYSWMNCYPGRGEGVFYPFGEFEMTIVYDQTYSIGKNQLPNARFFMNKEAWTIEERPGKNSLATYTFTDDDYAYAVEHGTVVAE